MYKSLRILLVVLLGFQANSFAQPPTVFNYLGVPQFYTVPAGVTQISVTARGARGGNNSDEVSNPDRPGYGGCVTAIIAVTPGQILQVNVGGCGGDGTATTGGTAGWNGGGLGSFGVAGSSGGGGGGGSDVRMEPYDNSGMLVVAGGGGGAGLNCGFDADRGGDGGSNLHAIPPPLYADSGRGCGSTTGGASGYTGSGLSGGNGIGGNCGGCFGSPGTTGTTSFAGEAIGGNGGSGSAGGGGGGGYYAGGGGQWSGGGGGSDFYNADGVYVQSEIRGCNNSCGVVTISIQCKPGSITAPDSVCAGSSIILTDLGGLPSGCITWSTSGTLGFTSLSARTCTSVRVTGVYLEDTIIGTWSTAGPGCYIKFPVTVNPVPDTISYAGHPSVPAWVCKGFTLQLIEASTGGTWSSSSPGIATVGTDGLVTGVATGVATIVYTFPTGCSTAMVVTVNPVPAVPTGIDSVCLTGVITLSSTTPGIGWGTYGGGTGAGSFLGAPGVFTSTASGTVDVCDTIAVTGCRSCVNVTVNPIPTAPTPTLACVGVPVTEVATPTPGTWSVTPTTLGTIDPVLGTITPGSVGTFTVTFTTSHGCFKSSIVTVNPNPPAITGGTSVCGGQCITMNETTVGAWTVSPVGVASVTTTPASSTTICGTLKSFASDSRVDTVIFTITATGCRATKVITINPEPHNITIASGQNPVCTGTCTTFATSDVGGVWSPATGLTGTIDPVTGIFCAVTTGTVSGTVVVQYTYTLTPGCATQRVISVNPMPVVTGPDSVCIGGTAVLCATPPGGTWSQAGIPSAVITVSPPAGGCINVTGETLGMDTLTYTRMGCSVVNVFTVNPAVGTIWGTKDNICEGDTATLFATPAGGTWASDLTAVAIIGSSDGVVQAVGSPTSGGIVHFTYTSPGGCAATLTMTINGLPGPIPPPHAICSSAGVVTIPAGSPWGAGAWWVTNSAVGTINAITGDFSPLSEDTTTICYTLNVGGCVSCDTLRVLPAPSVISGPGSVCEGFSITLTDPDGTSTWSVSNGSASIVATTGVLTGVDHTIFSGVDTIRFTNGGGCFATKTVTVHASPAPITGTLSICQGQTTVLRDATGSPNGSWSFSPPFGVVSLSPTFNTTSTTVTGTGAGTAIIDYTQGFFGCYSQTTVTVTSGVPPITGPGTLCQGSSATFSDFGATGTGTWSSSNTTIATTGTASGLSTTVTADAAGGPTGTTTITFSSSTGCAASTVVTVNQTPDALITPLGRTDLCPGDMAVLTSTTGLGFTYQWKRAGSPIIGATNSTYITNVPGAYTVTISVGTCTNTSPPVFVTMNPVTAGLSPLSSVACASTPPTLTATPAGGGISYQWIGTGGPIAGATASTFVPSLSGTYTVKVTNAFGCSGTSPAATITLLASPVFSVSPATATICSGTTVTLSGTTVPGVTYQWYFSPGGPFSPIAGATNATFAASAAGLYQLRESNGTCTTTSATIPLGVIAAPIATIVAGGDTIVCSGSSVSLAAPAGFTYQWYNGGIAIPGATNVTYVAATTGAYTVKVTAGGAGCSSTSRIQHVNIVPIPTVSPLSATSFCWGGSVRLSVSVSATGVGISYVWLKNGVVIPGVSGPTYTATTTGLYSVKVTLSSSIGIICAMTTRTVSVTQYPLPNPIVTFAGSFFHTGSFVTYQWYKNTVAIPGATTSAVHHLGIGSYSVRVTDVNGCQSVSPAYVLTFIPPAPPGTRDADDESVKNINDAANIKIYPNPAQNMVHVDAAMEVHAIITSIEGRTVIDQPAAKDIDLSKVPDGVYIIKLLNTEGVLMRTDKLVKAGGNR